MVADSIVVEDSRTRAVRPVWYGNVSFSAFG